MVLDIEKYPDFVPWCMDGIINERKEFAIKELTNVLQKINN